MTAVDFTAASGRDQFLQLLVTQLQHQDPLEPVGQQDFLQQLAQFSTVEGVEQLNARFADVLLAQQWGAGLQLVGRTVDYRTVADGPLLTGEIASLGRDQGRVVLQIGEDAVSLDQIEFLHSEPSAA